MNDDQQRRQLTSTWLNIAGAGIVSGGCVSQLAAAANGASLPICAVMLSACIASGSLLHVAALRLVKSKPRQDGSAPLDGQAH